MNPRRSRKSRPPTTAAGGFTLIELMIVVAILAILAMITYPTYQQYVIRSNRSEAINALNLAANEQERFLFSYGRYSANLSGPRTGDPLSSGLGLATTTREGPGDSAYYNLSVEIPAGCNGLCYTLRAAPQGSLQSRDKCQTLELKSNGERSAALANCW